MMVSKFEVIARSAKYVLCIICMTLFLITLSFGKKADSVIKNTLIQKNNDQSKGLQIKTDYARQKFYDNMSGLHVEIGQASSAKQEKILTVLKVYPNPVIEQINISLRLERNAVMSIKIIDLLGNEVITLLNEKTSAGEHTKTYLIPDRLNAGIYFLRIVAGGEPVVKRISVL